MKWLNDLPPAQRLAVIVGVPLVAVAALVSMMRRGGTATVSAAPSAAPTTAGQTLPVAVGTGAIGSGELAQFLNIFTDELEVIRRTIEEGETGQPITRPPTTAATLVSARAGETWKALLRRHYGPDGTNLWQVVRTHPANASLFRAYPSIDQVLPTGAIVTAPARNW